MAAASTSRVASLPADHRLVFVYGTIKRGEPNHWVFNQIEKGICGRLVAEAHTVRRYPLVVATTYRAPFLVDAEGYGHNVRGEIYVVDETMLRFLDRFEGHPTIYSRRRERVQVIEPVLSSPMASASATTLTTLHVDVTLQAGQHIECDIYFLQHYKHYFAKHLHPPLPHYSNAILTAKFNRSPASAPALLSSDATEASDEFTMAHEEKQLNALMKSLVEQPWDFPTGEESSDGEERLEPPLFD